jgi:hypothetical protein
VGELGNPLWVCNRGEFSRLFGGEIGNPLWVCIRGTESRVVWRGGGEMGRKCHESRIVGREKLGGKAKR